MITLSQSEESRQTLQATLDALSAHLAILDESGVIVSVNAAWDRFARCNQAVSNAFSTGANYLEVCDCSHGDCAAEAATVARGIRAVLAGQVEEFRLEYPCHSPREQRWFVVRATRFGEPGAWRIVVAHENITERKQAEIALLEAQRALVENSRQAGMAEVAAGVLHNVGNVLNSVNVSAALVVDQVKKSGCASLTRVVALLREHEADLGEFITTDPQGRQIPAFLEKLAGKLGAEQSSQLAELAALQKSLEQIKQVVAMHQNYARVAGPKETVQLDAWLAETLRLEGAELLGPDLTVVREFSTVPALTLDKPKLHQILGHLLRNAGQACADSARPDPQVTLRLQTTGGRVQLAVGDNGVGIPAENLTRIFQHGFTTKKDGHGFGLHSAANAARELGGALTAESAGSGLGATFTLELPLEPVPAA